MKISDTIPVHQSVPGKEGPPFSAYKVNGRVTIHENDEIAARLDECVRAGHKTEFKASREQLAAVCFTVEEVYDQTPDPETAGKRIA
jgi:hypothetical protein